MDGTGKFIEKARTFLEKRGSVVTLRVTAVVHSVTGKTRRAQCV
jgi:hypothetical protein